MRGREKILKYHQREGRGSIHVQTLVNGALSIIINSRERKGGGEREGIVSLQNRE